MGPKKRSPLVPRPSEAKRASNGQISNMYPRSTFRGNLLFRVRIYFKGGVRILLGKLEHTHLSFKVDTLKSRLPLKADRGQNFEFWPRTVSGPGGSLLWTRFTPSALVQRSADPNGTILAPFSGFVGPCRIRSTFKGGCVKILQDPPGGA